MEKFKLKKLSALELRKPQIEISISFALKKLNDRNRLGKTLMSVSWNSIGTGSNYCTVICLKRLIFIIFCLEWKHASGDNMY